MQLYYYKIGFSDVRYGRHQDKLAVDFNLFLDNGKGVFMYTKKKENYRPIGEFWKSLHPKNRWGGNFKMRNKKSDPGHFEMQK